MKRGVLAIGLLAAIGAIAVLVSSRSIGSGDRGLADPTTDTSDAAGDAAAPPPLPAGGGLRRTPDRAAATPAPKVEPKHPAGAARVVGRIVDPEGRPVAGAIVGLANAGPGDPTAVTDADGRFALDGPPGATAVVVSKEGFADETVTMEALAAGGRVALRKSWVISGTVREQGTDAPIASVPVMASPATSPGSRTSALAMSGADGAFTLTVPAAGVYVLDVNTNAVFGEPMPGDDFMRARLEAVAAGARDVRVKLERGRAIEGEIVDDAGQRVARPLTIDAVGRNPAGDADYTTRKLVRSNDGVLRVAGLRPGRYDVWIRPDAEAKDADGAAVSATVVRDVAAGTAGLVVRLVRGYMLVGRLVDAEGAAVIATGNVYAYPAGEMAKSHAVSAEVPLDGTFRVGPLDDGLRYDLLATGFAGHREARALSVAPRDAGGVTIILPKGARIRGRIQTVEGKPVPAGVPIGVIMEGAEPREPGTRLFTYSGADSTFVADGLADGPFTVQAGGGRSGYLGAVVKGIKAGADDVVLRVAEGVELSGTLVDEKGEPVATTSLQADDGARLAAMRPFAQVGSDGKFLFRGLRPGRIRLLARIGDASVSAGEVEAPGVNVKATLAPK